MRVLCSDDRRLMRRSCRAKFGFAAYFRPRVSDSYTNVAVQYVPAVRSGETVEVMLQTEEIDEEKALLVATARTAAGDMRSEIRYAYCT